MTATDARYGALDTAARIALLMAWCALFWFAQRFAIRVFCQEHLAHGDASSECVEPEAR